MNVIIMLKNLGSLAKSQITILSMLPHEDGNSQNEKLVHLEKDILALKIQDSLGYLPLEHGVLWR